MLPKRSSENTVLVQLDDQELDMKGDAGTIGRLRVKDGRIELDLNGKRLHGQIYPSVTCMVVSINRTEARVTQLVDEICVVSSQEDIMKKMGGDVIGGQKFEEEDDIKKKSKSTTKSYKSEKKVPRSAKKKKPAASTDVVDLS